MLSSPTEKLLSRWRVNRRKKPNIMGDKSPKATQKKSTQKQSKATAAGQKKQQAVAAKQSGKKK